MPNVSGFFWRVGGQVLQHKFEVGSAGFKKKTADAFFPLQGLQMMYNSEASSSQTRLKITIKTKCYELNQLRSALPQHLLIGNQHKVNDVCDFFFFINET